MRVETARHTVEQFHRGYNQQDYQSMYNLGGPAVRKTTTERDFSNYETGVRARLGALKSADVVNYNILYLLSGPQVRLDYSCTYERGSAVESFEVNFRGEKPQIDGYRIDSPQLDEKSR